MNGADDDLELVGAKKRSGTRTAIIGVVVCVFGFASVVIWTFNVPLRVSVAFFWGVYLSFMAVAFSGFALFVRGLLVRYRALQSVPTFRERRQRTYSLYRKSALPTALGAIGYLVATLVSGLLIPTPEVLKSTVEALNAPNAISFFFVGCIIAFPVSYYSIYYSKRIAPSNTLTRTFILAALALFIVEGLLTLQDLSDALNYYFLSLAVNAPRYLLLGLFVGIAIRARPLVESTDT